MKWSMVILVLLIPTVVMASSVTVQWDAPAFNCDNSQLTDLAGYVVMWGDEEGGPYPNQHDVDDPAATQAVIDVGVMENVTLHFVIVSVDESGNRSDDIGGCGVSNSVAIPFPRTFPRPPVGVAVQ